MKKFRFTAQSKAIELPTENGVLRIAGDFDFQLQMFVSIPADDPNADEADIVRIPANGISDSGALGSP